MSHFILLTKMSNSGTGTQTPTHDDVEAVCHDKELVVIICSTNKMKVKAVREAISSEDVWEKLTTEGYLFDKCTTCTVKSIECQSRVAEQPLGTAAWVGAKNRIMDAKRQTLEYQNNQYIMPIYIAIENGLFNMGHPNPSFHFDCPIIHISDGEGIVGRAIGSGCPVNFEGLTYESKTVEHCNTDNDPNVKKYREFVANHIPDNSISTYFTHNIEDRVNSMRIGVRTALGNLIRSRIIHMAK